MTTLRGQFIVKGIILAIPSFFSNCFLVPFKGGLLVSLGYPLVGAYSWGFLCTFQSQHSTPWMRKHTMMNVLFNVPPCFSLFSLLLNIFIMLLTGKKMDYNVHLLIIG